MLSERLKEETKQAHIEVETLIIPRIKNLESNKAYKDLLHIFYGYFKPVEEKIAFYITNNTLPDLHERRKADIILKDMKHLVSDEQLQLCNELPGINSTASALGALYVLEGSTLGGQYISKMITDRIPVSPEEGVQFFTGYGPDTFTKWNVFKDHLNQFSGQETVEDEIIQAANETFIKFRNWIKIN